MFNLDKIIEEANKKLLYGEKPEIPKKLEIRIPIIEKDGNNFSVVGEREPTIREIVELLNKIIDYLEWTDK